MSEKDAKIWRKLHNLFPPTVQESQMALELYRIAISHGSIPLSINEMLQLNHAIIFDFYFRLAMFTTPGRSFYRKKSTLWFKRLNLHRFNLKEMGGFLALLKIAPLLKGQSIALSKITLSDTNHPHETLSHAIFDESLADVDLLNNNFSYEMQLELVFEALQRLKIAIGLEIEPSISPESVAVARRPDMFKVDRGVIYFDITKKIALDYLSTAVGRLSKKLNFDFVFYNFTMLAEVLTPSSISYIVNESRVRPSFGVALLPLNTFDDLATSATKVINLTPLAQENKPFWRYLSNNLKLFTYIDKINRSSYIEILRSRIIAQIDFEKMSLLALVNEKDYGLIIKSDRRHLFIGYFTYQPCKELSIDLHQYYSQLAIYAQSSEIFFNHHYQFTENELQSKNILTIPALNKETIMCYLIS